MLTLAPLERMVVLAVLEQSESFDAHEFCDGDAVEHLGKVEVLRADGAFLKEHLAASLLDIVKVISRRSSYPPVEIRSRRWIYFGCVFCCLVLGAEDNRRRTVADRRAGEGGHRGSDRPCVDDIFDRAILLILRSGVVATVFMVLDRNIAKCSLVVPTSSILLQREAPSGRAG